MPSRPWVKTHGYRQGAATRPETSHCQFSHLEPHLEIHLFQLANFLKTAEELSDPLDCWLYFLNNGSSLDPDDLPASMHRPEIEKAVEVLEMLTQDEAQREMYEAREKARRDAASWQSALEQWKQEVDHLKQEADRAKQQATTSRAEGRAEGRVQGELIGQMRAYEQMLGRKPTPEDNLTGLSLDELAALVEQLRTQLDGGKQP